MSMIKLVRLSVEGADTLRVAFSDGSSGRWSAAELIARDTVMTRPLADPAYFARAFIEAGALSWPNGFELSAPSLHRRLDEAGASFAPPPDRLAPPPPKSPHFDKQIQTDTASKNPSRPIGIPRPSA